MVGPVAALAGFFGVLALAALLAWPRRGLVRRWRRARHATERVRIEDSLKHLHDFEYRGRWASIESVAGALEVTRSRAAALLGLMEVRGLVRSAEAGVRLTEEGRAYALQVLRSHRLWERWLADRTGLEPDEWHEEAELREHALSPAEAEALSARLGHPRFDPHGDPIPASDGTLPPAVGVPLTALEPGTVASVVHVEDEPPEVYARLVGAGLSPHVRVEVLAAEAGGVRIRAGGRERVLDAVAAANVTVSEEAGPGAEAAVPETLAALAPGETATVVRISPACVGAQRRRLLDLGVVRGTRVTARLASASGDPVAYEIRGALIALRRSQAEWIEVRREPAAGAA